MSFFSSFLLEDPHFFSFSKKEDNYYFHALKLARYSIGLSPPNPSVGAVIVKENRIISQGFTMLQGGMHAEKMAIEHAFDSTVGATLYSTLEPCSHQGKTPPCVDAIIKAGIKEVVYGVLDETEKVNGRGLKKLKEHGILVRPIKNPILIKATQESLQPFFWKEATQKPYVIVKIATDRNFAIGQNAQKVKITSAPFDYIAHGLRRVCDAILIGRNTLETDDPKLTNRLFLGHGKNPWPCIISGLGKLDSSKTLFKNPLQTPLVFTAQKSFLPNYVKISSQNNHLDLNEVLIRLGELGVNTLLVEAGKTLFESFIKANIANEIWWAKAPIVIHNQPLTLNIKPQELLISHQLAHETYIGNDELSVFVKNSD